MTDIAEKLLQMHRLSIAWSDSDVLLDAADEIKRLREYGVQARLRENEAEQARVSLSFENERLRAKNRQLASTLATRLLDNNAMTAGNVTSHKSDDNG